MMAVQENLDKQARTPLDLKVDADILKARREHLRRVAEHRLTNPTATDEREEEAR
jgi:hypothetical protein